ncbi:hypothetical protein [Streptococcus oralis]|uniref:hypothetical protein n=1 Tax=Streptococcus oralis TaxID=1303 RepID=UPI0001CC5C94|nr:hypothetical protein [Streptococcus oralis]EFE57674.1 hypothetical protein HMPREF8579_0256 [Streptococcus oralis ATCC 35037]EFO02735.1 hypothetical protein SMSK23_0473 [Streptococcus oralis ATCC 35037]KZX05047.1 hypothetical protein A4222_01015 [Streptococcus oralis]OOR77801.1 hypothetical protein B0176_06455 [Streptococcus oralis]QQB71126.1 hypothetical protein I6H77_04745 [Streptococcus oralis]
MKITKIISNLLAIGALLMLLSACQNIKKTQLVLFESLSFGMSPKSFEEVLGNASEVEEEEETAYRDTWRAEDPYFYKTGRLFYHYEQITLKGYTGRATFTFSKSHHLEEATVHIPVTSKVEQKVVLNNLSQTVKKELEELPDYQSMTTDTVGLYDDGYRYKVKLKGQQWELWVDVYPTENKYVTDTEIDKYTIRVDQFLMYP